MGYLGEAYGIKTKDQCHCAFSNLDLKGKLREAVKFIFGQETGDFCNPKNW